MSKYFDLEILKRMIEAKSQMVMPDHASAFLYISKWLDHLPAADVAPVLHAHWTCVNDAENVYMCDGKDGCGCCIQVMAQGKPIDFDLGFCTHCGAKMDEEVRNE